MIVPTSLRRDRSVAVITVHLDNKNTDTLKKFHCSICGYIVFGYYDTAHVLVPEDSTTTRMKDLKNAVNEIECIGRTKDEKGYYNRCRTIYVLNRG